VFVIIQNYSVNASFKFNNLVFQYILILLTGNYLQVILFLKIY